MENPATYPSARNPGISARTASDPDFIGAEAALKRASIKAIERARRAGLEPVILNPKDSPTEAVLREDPAPYQGIRNPKQCDG